MQNVAADKGVDILSRERIAAAFEAATLPQRNVSNLRNSLSVDLGTVRFVENKPVDFQAVEAIMEPSRRLNHFTNFGPVTAALEKVLHHLWRLSEDRVVIAASSATTALYALVGVHSAKLGRPLRLAASSFGFMSTNIGTLTNSILVDCDETGMLNLEALDEAILGQVDALLVTNIFGNFRSMERYKAFCERHGKILLVDNATGFSGVNRAEDFDEIISFHHTKAWGVGEGGVAVLNRDDATLFRSLLNFGTGAPEWLWMYANNAKISDFASALILERLERIPEWSRQYDEQLQRIMSLGDQCGLRPLIDGHRDQLHAHVPFQSPHSISADRVNGSSLPMRKYYRPLGPNTPTASDIFDRNICVPAHLQMSALSDDAILTALQEFL